MRILILFFCSLVFLCAFKKEGQTQTGRVRKAVVAGQFYPADAKELRSDIDSYLAAASPVDLGGELFAISVPHAGYAYSGKTAATGYKQVVGRDFDLVVVMAPSHREYFSGGSVFGGEAYETPLGQMMIDQTLATELTKDSKVFVLSEVGHGMEHSLEVQVPFLQMVLPKAKLLPIVIGDFDWTMAQKMGQELAQHLKGRKVLLVASTDLYHGENYNECKRTDENTLKAMVALQPEALCSGFKRETFMACGAGPVVVMQVAAKALGADAARLISRTNSNEVTGEIGGYVVGYGAVVYYRAVKSGRMEFKELELPVQKELLRMAREAIKGYLDSGSIPTFKPIFPVMNEKRGVFVTLTEGGMLRGCIGYHESDRPLYELVPDRAVAAAFEDPRFEPLNRDELAKIKIKVSVYLTNVYKIDNLSEFVMGEQGIIMMKGNRGATYLPEVPAEAGWKTVDEEMESLCQKAGLPRGAWKQGCDFYVYRTQVFGEEILKE